MTEDKKEWNDKYWKYPGSPFKNETAWWNWLRGSIRRTWSRSPVKIAYKQSRRYKAPVGKNGKEVFVSDCEMCGKQSRNCEVDHLEGGKGFHDWETFVEWQKRILLVSFDDIQELCKDCHAIVSHAQRYDMSFDVAKADKEAKAIVDAKEEKNFLLENNILPASAQKNRREQVFQVLLRRLNEKK